MASKEEAAPSLDAQIAAELQRNRDLTYKLYVARGEVPPDDNACAAACPASPTIRAPLRSRLERVVAQERVLDVRRAVRGEAAAMGGLRLPSRRGLPVHRNLQAHAHRRLLHVLSSATPTARLVTTQWWPTAIPGSMLAATIDIETAIPAQNS